jgi:hypothetical protein
MLRSSQGMKDSDYLRHLGQLTLSLWTAASRSGSLSRLNSETASRLNLSVKEDERSAGGTGRALTSAI